MSYRQTPSSRSSTKGFQLGLQPALAWTAILGLVLVIVLGLLVGAGSILSLVLPFGSFALGVLLYRRYPVLYVGFTWWLWFLAPLVKRLIDYKSGYPTFGALTLSASLVTSISFVTLVQHLPRHLVKLHNGDGLPFILCAGSVVYGYLIGFTRQSITIELREILFPLLTWLGPIAFGFHLFVNWRDYPSYRRNTQRTFFWGVVVMGGYGILQFLIVPDWDKFYLNAYRKAFSLGWLGEPEPLEIRVWSTMSDPFSFSGILMPGLILLLANRGNFHFAVTGLGYVVFLLTRVRTGWYTWLLSALVFTFSVKGGKQLRTVINFTTIFLIILLLSSLAPFFTVITERFDSFLNLENDDSFQERARQIDNLMSHALSEFIGLGLLGTTGVSIDGSDGSFAAVDTGYLTLLLSLGWFGTIPFLSGLVLIFFKLSQSFAGRFDVFFIAARAIAVGSFMRIFTADIVHNEAALSIWGFLGLAMAADKYYLHQCTAEPNREF